MMFKISLKLIILCLSLFFTLVLILSIVVIRIKEKKKLAKEFRQRKQFLLEQVKHFFEEYSELNNQYISESQIHIFSKKWQNLYSEIAKYNNLKKNNKFTEIQKFQDVYKSLYHNFSTINENFILSESQKYNSFFSNIDGKSLDEQQRAAVITDDERILILAGAGSGKTLTISAKVKYLCEVKNINPNEILLISFTKKAAQEMTDRIQNKLGIPCEATTFHKLGLDIIKNTENKRPEICDEDELYMFIHNFFENEILKHPQFIKDLTEYFIYYLDIPNNIENYSSLGELYEEEKSSDLETLKSKYDREKFIQKTGIEKSKTFTTLKNEKVKSIEETKIANFLFMHGVNYEYERVYPFESNDSLRKTYRPDFYLTDYDIYLEHFGISRNFTVPWLSPVEEKKYLDGIEWKRSFHKKNGTRLLETYSYYSSEGILLKKLEEILIKNGIEFKDRDFIDIFNTVYASKSNKYFSEFIKLCCTFITLFKSNSYKIEDIENLKKESLSHEVNMFLRKRTNLFLDIIKVIISEYQNMLSQNNSIDFSDMINNATDIVSSGVDLYPYKYVIIDEYQDISISRFNLIKAIIDKTGAKLFCVGDDWQSIYRFAGSDISLFTNFQKYFSYTKILKIEKTYRNSQNLINEASSFILRNPLQLNKNLKSDKKLDYPLVFWGFDDSPKQALKFVINKIVSEFGENSSILLLGRTNYDFDILKQSDFFRIIRKNQKEQLKYIPIPDLQIDFLTVHKAKGLEADNVIILNFYNDKLGFPNQIADDKVLNLVLTTSEDFKYAEERRLFYVAITRTRNRTFVLTNNNNPSPFFKEFSESNSVCFVSIQKNNIDKQTLCPLCKTGKLLKVNNNGKHFIGCSNFPKCNYTVNETSILVNPKHCPRCGGFLIKRKGKNKYWFCGCTNYPYCTYTEQL